MKDSGDFALIVMTCIVIVFTVTYGFRSPWSTNRVGKVFLAKSIVFSFVLMQVTVSVILGLDYWGRVPIRTFIYWAGAVAYLVMLTQLVRQQQEDRTRRRRAEVRRRAHGRILARARARHDSQLDS